MSTYIEDSISTIVHYRGHHSPYSNTLRIENTYKKWYMINLHLIEPILCIYLFDIIKNLIYLSFNLRGCHTHMCCLRRAVFFKI